jgi:four helix bundle protein
MPRDPGKLAVFTHAHKLVLDVYRLTTRLPRAKQFGLSAQLRRAAVSISTNIVEGSSRESAREYDRFLEISHGSAAEVRYLLRLITDLGLISPGEVVDCRECSDRVVRMLQNLRRAVGCFQA